MTPRIEEPENMSNSVTAKDIEVSVTKTEMNGAVASSSKSLNGNNLKFEHSTEIPEVFLNYEASPVAEATRYVTSRPEEAVKLRITEETKRVKPRTIPSLLRQQANSYPDRCALRVKRDGEWKIWSYKQYYADVMQAAKSFMKIGLADYHGVGILGFNSPEWFIADLGAISAGGLAVGIYTTNSPEACQYVLENANCDAVVVEDEKCLSRIWEVRDELPNLKAVIVYSPKNKDFKEKYSFGKEDFLYSWSEFMQLGNEIDDKTILDKMDSLVANKCCTLIYTSGTTGVPKGAMLSHDNITYTTLVSDAVAGLRIDPVEVLISYLPLSHVAAQIIDLYLPLLVAGEVWFADPDALKGSLLKTLTEAQPTRFLGVPRVWEKIEDKMKTTGASVPFVLKKISAWAKAVGLRANLAKIEGRPMPFGYGLAKKLVFNKVRHRLGLSRCTLSASGAAPLMRDTLEYFLSLDIPVFEMYGMSESTGPHTINLDGCHKVGSVGREIPGYESKILNPDEKGNGELCMKGRHVFMGYLGTEEKTLEVFDDNTEWLHTGDIVRRDKDGLIYITGRIKEIVITAGGENVSPVAIEDAIKEACPEIISNVILIGDKRKFLSVLITLRCKMDEEGAPTDILDTRALNAIKESTGDKLTTVEEAYASAKLRKVINDAIEVANTHAISRAQRVAKFEILKHDFSLPGGELGPTMKMKRRVVTDKYSEIIDKIYEEVH